MTTYIVRTGTKDTKVSISDADFVASGGEKSVYRKGATAYCVYHDPKNVSPTAKIDELKKVKHRGFIRPESLLLDLSGARVGETLPYIKDTYVLCELFANAFRTKQGVDHKTDLGVLSQMFDLTQAAHEAGITLVDHNDMNWLVSHTFKNVSLVDTLSAQTPSFPATAIKPAIRDVFSQTFTKETDYYSLAILTAWLWCGIHPYTVMIDGFKGGMPEKQAAMRSIFDKAVLLNASVRPIDTMPDDLQTWVHTHLTTKYRPALPSLSGTTVRKTGKKQTVVVPQVGAVTWELLRGTQGTYPWTMDNCTYDFVSNTVIEQVSSNVVKINGISGVVEFAHEVLLHDGMMYVIQGDKLCLVGWRVVNSQLRFSIKEIAILADMPNATLYGQGCVVQDLLGRKVVHTYDYQFILHMQGYRILHAASHSNTVMLTAIKRKKLYRVTATQHKTINTVDVQYEEMLQAELPNFCVTKNKVIVENRGGELIARVGRGSSQIEKRGTLPPTMQLHTDGSRVLGIMDSKPYQIRLA